MRYSPPRNKPEQTENGEIVIKGLFTDWFCS